MPFHYSTPERGVKFVADGRFRKQFQRRDAEFAEAAESEGIGPLRLCASAPLR